MDKNGMGGRFTVTVFYDQHGAVDKAWGAWYAETRRDGLLVRARGSERQQAIERLAQRLAGEHWKVALKRFAVTQAAGSKVPTVRVNRTPPPRHVRDSGRWPIATVTI